MTIAPAGTPVLGEAPASVDIPQAVPPIFPAAARRTEAADANFKHREKEAHAIGMGFFFICEDF